MKTSAWLSFAVVSLSLVILSTSGCAPQDNPIALSVLTSGSGNGTVAASGAQPLASKSTNPPGAPTQISCQSGDSQNCAADYESGSVITLTASAAPNSAFAGWSGACSGTAPTCEVTLNEAETVTAQFNLAHDNLQISIAGSGGGTVTSVSSTIDCGNYTNAPHVCSETVVQDSTVTLSEVAQPNSHFAGWSGGGCTGTASTCVVNVGQAEAVTATFTLIQLSAPLVSTVGWGANAQGQVQALGLNYYIAAYGIYPSTSGGANNTGTPYLGQIMLFAANFAPTGWLLCNGSLLNISTNAALFSLLGTTYGGDGQSTFAIPDLRARVPMGIGALANATNPPQSPGVSTVPLISSATWGATPQGQVHALGVNYYVAAFGVYPSSNGTTNSGGAYLGQLMLFAGNFAPSGWLLCDGSLLNISTNTALFSLIGTTYGGNGQSTFALPDLRARVPMGVGALSNPSGPPQVPGAPEVPLVTTLALGATAQGQVGVLGMNYYIADYGVYPSANGTTNNSGAYVAQLMLFAGNFAPTGWSLCNGSQQNISTNTALFSLLGTTFGGDGQSTFALPDLRARVPMGVGSN